MVVYQCFNCGKLTLIGYRCNCNNWNPIDSGLRAIKKRTYIKKPDYFDSLPKDRFNSRWFQVTH